MSTIPTPSTIVPVTFVPSAAHAPPTALQVHRFTVDEYERLGELGLLPYDQRTELLEGVVVDMMSPGSQHSLSVDLILRVLMPILPAGWTNSGQRSVVFSDSLTEPDGVVMRGDLRSYTNHKTRADEVAIIIEVSDSSLAHDRNNKLPVYATAGIPEYWIVNLPEHHLEVYRKPLVASVDRPAHYQSIEVLGPDQSFDVLIEGAKVGSIIVRDILP